MKTIPIIFIAIGVFAESTTALRFEMNRSV